MNAVTAVVARILCERDGCRPEETRTIVFDEVVGYREGTSPATRPKSVQRPLLMDYKFPAEDFVKRLEAAGYVIAPSQEPSK